MTDASDDVVMSLTTVDLTRLIHGEETLDFVNDGTAYCSELGAAMERFLDDEEALRNNYVPELNCVVLQFEGARYGDLLLLAYELRERALVADIFWLKDKPVLCLPVFR